MFKEILEQQRYRTLDTMIIEMLIFFSGTTRQNYIF